MLWTSRSRFLTLVPMEQVKNHCFLPVVWEGLMKFYCFFWGNQIWFKLYGHFGFPSRFFSCIFMNQLTGPPNSWGPQRLGCHEPSTCMESSISNGNKRWESVRIGSSWWESPTNPNVVGAGCNFLYQTIHPSAIGAIGRSVGCRYHWNCGDMTFRSIWT